MPREQLAARLLVVAKRASTCRSIRSGKLQREDWSKLTEAAARLGRLPLWLDDTPALTLLDLRAKIRRLQAELSAERHRHAPRRSSAWWSSTTCS